MSQEGASDPLVLVSLDRESLFDALGAVEKAVPQLLLQVKPILAHLDGRTSVDQATLSLDRYMDILDKIQDILRHTIYYLRETNASITSLRPPPVNAIPTPFASSLPLPQPSLPFSSNAGGGPGEAARSGSGSWHEHGQEIVDLGLYGSRIEERTLRDLVAVLKKVRSERTERSQLEQEGLAQEGRGSSELDIGDGGDRNDEGDGDEGMEIDRSPLPP